MSDVINLNKARKAKLKQQKATKAAQNRVVFGTSTEERKRERQRQNRASDTLDGHLRKLPFTTKTIDEDQ